MLFIELFDITQVRVSNDIAKNVQFSVRSFFALNLLVYFSYMKKSDQNNILTVCI